LGVGQRAILWPLVACCVIVSLRSQTLTPAARQAEVLSEALLGVGVALLELPPDDALAVVRCSADDR
jgi:hypothetical protein